MGEQAGNVGRMVVLACKEIPESVPGVAVDRQCGSSQQAIHFAAMAVMSGVQDCVVACGVESMTRIPIGANIMDGIKLGRGMPSDAAGIQEKRPGVQFSQFTGAELLAQKYDITREEMEALAVASHAKAVNATEKGYFKKEIVPLQGKDKEGNVITHDTDEGIRPSTTAASLAKLKPLAGKDGRITAATSSQIADGASALLICNERGLKKLGLTPRARIVEMALAGSDPVIMLEGPVPATQNVFKRSGLTIKDMDLTECNEAFAPVPLALVKDQGIDLATLNVNGGAMALGHPLGATVSCRVANCSAVHPLFLVEC